MVLVESPFHLTVTIFVLLVRKTKVFFMVKISNIDIIFAVDEHCKRLFYNSVFRLLGTIEANFSTYQES